MVGGSNPSDRELIAIGYRCLHRSPDAGNYLRGDERVDFLYASRPAARGLLEHATLLQTTFGDVRVVSPEGLIGLKIQAFVNNPRRTQDLEDIKALVAANRQALKIDEVREYFRLFNREALLGEILKLAYLLITDNRLPPMAVSLTCLRLRAVIHLKP